MRRPSDRVRRIEESIGRRFSGREDPHQRRIDRLRARGVRIGEGCWIPSSGFSTEPWLIEIGNRVAISAGVEFVTHEGSAWLLRDRHPDIQVFGRIRLGDDSLIGLNAAAIPGRADRPRGRLK